MAVYANASKRVWFLSNLKKTKNFSNFFLPQVNKARKKKKVKWDFFK
jgi:hypothetical protein